MGVGYSLRNLVPSGLDLVLLLNRYVNLAKLLNFLKPWFTVG
jgi:hypothetical protein